MSAIRPLERGDLPAVARLYERVARSAAPEPPAWLARYFARTLLDHPWVDPEIPSLVYEEPDGRIAGFIGSHVRRLRLDGRSLRMACSGQLTADPSARTPAVGALLLRRYLGGPQELTVTDGATDTVRAMWERLGGHSATLHSIGWTRVLRPWAFAAAVVRRRRGRSAFSGGGPGAIAALDAVSGSVGRCWLRPSSPDGGAEELTTAALVEGLQRLDAAVRLRPAYDEAFLGWLFRELAAVRTRGALVRRLVRRPGGRPAGWYVYYLSCAGISQVLQVGATREDAGLVLDHLLRDADRGGAAAVQGRVEPHLLAALSTRRCLFRRSEWALLHARDPAPLAAAALGEALLTRMEGEWWMGHLSARKL